MKNIYTILLWFIAFGVQSQIVNIPDVNFKAKLLSSDTTNTIAQDVNGNNIKIDANNNGEIEVGEALLVSKLFYSDSIGPPPFKMQNTNTVQALPFTDLTGIAAFANLKYLNIINNQLTTLDVSSNLLLIELLCNGNLLTSINVSGLTNLSVLYVANNDLTSLDTSSLTSLANLQCGSNAITALDLSLCTQLKYLDCNFNELSSLNLTNATQLARLLCHDNHIDILNVNAPTTLEYFYCYNNQITSPINLNNYTALIFFMCQNNQISSLSFGNNANLQQVWCGNNNFDVLDLSGTAVSRLSCGDNPNLSFLNVKNGILTPDLYVSQFPEPPYTEDSFKLLNTPALLYICHDEGEFGPELVANEGLENVSRGSYCSFTPGGNYNTINGNVTFDCGGTNSAMENQNVNVTGNLQSGATYTNSNGLYRFYSDGTTVTVTPQFANPDYFTVTPANYTFSFVDFGNTETANFCVAANGIHPDLEVSILPLTPARPGFDAKYKLVYSNKGNQIQSGSVTLSFDDAVLDFVSAVPALSSQAVNTLTWDFSNLIPYQSQEIEVILNVNTPTETPPVNIGNPLYYQAVISTAQTDETPADNQMNYQQIVVGSFDPNDKEVVEGSVIDIDQTDDYLHYVIRFQNTGNSEAENIVVKDVLDAKLDWSTLQMVSSSHPYRTTLTSGNKLEVFYDGINLPASSANETASHGYIAFKIKPKNTVMIFDVIPNFASIYFDFNFPIVTNTVNTTISALGIPGFSKDLFRLYPNPAATILNISVSDNTIIKKVAIVNTLGQIVMRSTEKAIDVSSLTSGTYFVTVETDTGKETKKMIKL